MPSAGLLLKPDRVVKEDDVPASERLIHLVEGQLPVCRPNMNEEFPLGKRLLEIPFEPFDLLCEALEPFARFGTLYINRNLYIFAIELSPNSGHHS